MSIDWIPVQSGPVSARPAPLTMVTAKKQHDEDAGARAAIAIERWRRLALLRLGEGRFHLANADHRALACHALPTRCLRRCRGTVDFEQQRRKQREPDTGWRRRTSCGWRGRRFGPARRAGDRRGTAASEHAGAEHQRGSHHRWRRNSRAARARTATATSNDGIKQDLQPRRVGTGDHRQHRNPRPARSRRKRKQRQAPRNAAAVQKKMIRNNSSGFDRQRAGVRGDPGHHRRKGGLRRRRSRCSARSGASATSCRSRHKKKMVKASSAPGIPVDQDAERHHPRRRRASARTPSLPMPSPRPARDRPVGRVRDNQSVDVAFQRHCSARRTRRRPTAMQSSEVKASTGWKCPGARSRGPTSAVKITSDITPRLQQREDNRRPRPRNPGPKFDWRCDRRRTRWASLFLRRCGAGKAPRFV